jgi:hypothetical protein
MVDIMNLKSIPVLVAVLFLMVFNLISVKGMEIKNLLSGNNPKVIINEILADPNGDANGDGTVSSNDDEFVELVNNSGGDIDLSNWTIFDNTGVRFTFSSPIVIEHGKAIVIFGGGTPAGSFGGALVLITSSLSLNNSGDDVILKDDLGNIVDSYTYGSEGGNDQSLAREPNLFGAFVKHTTITGNSVNYSPGLHNTDNTPFNTTATLTAQMDDALSNDADGNSIISPGDEIEYSITISNSGDVDGLNIEYKSDADVNSSLVGGSVKTTPLILDDAYSTFQDTQLNNTAADGLLNNDSDPDGSGGIIVVSYGTIANPDAVPIGGGSATTDNGGKVTVNADGSFVFDPPAGFSGTDKFSYKAEDIDNNIGNAKVIIKIK